jgi:pimeloyl-ACP methyl ester carboxylesterase
MHWEESDIGAGGIRLHVYRSGHGSTPLVLAHGLGDSGRCFDRLASRLADAYDIVSYDARNHGLSDDGPSSQENSVNDLIAVVETLGLDRPLALGHSMGAQTVALAVGERPDLFRAAVLEDPPWGLELPPAPPSLADVSKEQLEALEAIFAAWRERQRTQTYDSLMAEGRQSHPLWTEEDLSGWATSTLQFRQPDPTDPGLPAATVPPWEPIAERITIPALLVCGEPELGAIVKPAVADGARALCPTLEVARFSAGHDIRRASFEPFFDTVSRFLAAHAHGPASR